MSNGKELATINEKALSLKQYLNNDNIKRQIMDAAPKMLNGERFLKVFYGAILRNPKLLECTTESMLQAAMFFSQLGLEPILGRAYLVPYLNSKYIDGRWQKQYEVQAQVGYQGLVDLARRSSTISDVWGASVYENDEFDLSYGMERYLTHRPWFMDPKKRKGEAGAGDFLGAYVVWQLKDGTKHPEFMPASEIWKRRAKSQAYAYAETGDPSKGGGKKDSVWHQWPEEMALKTVIKHSSKLVPASIEFMEAVQMDDDRDNGFRPAGFLPEITDNKTGASEPSFEEVFSTEIADPMWQAYLAAACNLYKLSEYDARAEFVKQPEQIKRLFADWKKRAPAGTATAEDAKLYTAGAGGQPAGAAPPAGEKSFRDEWINLKGPGFSTFVWKNIPRFKAASPSDFQEAADKWAKLYPGVKCPFVDPPAPENGKDSAGEAQGDATQQDQEASPEQIEFDARGVELQILWQKASFRLVEAQKKLGFATGRIWPGSLDGRVILIEETRKLMGGDVAAK